MRYLQLDALRGVMLISMVLGHLGARLHLGPTHHLVFKTLLINDAASGFVFLSGLTVGLAYTKGWTDPAYLSRKGALATRTVLVFSHHALLVAIVTGLAILAIHSGRQIWIFDSYGDAPLLFGVLSLLMLTGGWSMDILPMYVLFLLLTPFALSAATRGHRWIVISAVVIAWLAGQAGLADAGWNSLENVFGLERWNIQLGIYFNRLSWSALYFPGLLFGNAYARGEFDLSVLKRRQFVPLLLACMALITGLMALLMMYLQGSVSAHFATFAWSVSKGGLGTLSLVNFAATTFVVTWFLAAGPTSPYRTTQALAGILGRILRCRPLVLLGQHSLLVFTYHVIGVYLFYVLVDTQQFHPLAANLILLLGIVSLAIPVAIGHHLKDRKRRILYTEPAR